MKKLTNMIEYNTKGELVGLEDNIITTQVVKKDSVETDEVNLNEMLEDIREFCNVNANKNIEFKLMAKVTQE